MEIVSVMRIMRRQTLVWHRRGARSVFPSEMIGTVKVQLGWSAQYPLRRLLSCAKVWSLAHGIADVLHLLRVSGKLSSGRLLRRGGRAANRARRRPVSTQHAARALVPCDPMCSPRTMSID